jgi:hypothetical protein
MSVPRPVSTRHYIFSWVGPDAETDRCIAKGTVGKLIRAIKAKTMTAAQGAVAPAVATDPTLIISFAVVLHAPVKK